MIDIDTQTTLVENPFANPELLRFLLRSAVLLGTGLLVMTLTQITNLRRMLGSLGFKKFCSWLVIVPLLLLIIYSGALPFLLLVLFFLWRGGAELLRMLRVPPFYKKLFALLQLVTVGVMVLSPDNVLLLPVFYLVAAFVAAGLRNRMHQVLEHTTLTVLSSLWIGFFLALLFVLYRGEHGKTLAILIFGMVVVSDVFAYLLGGIARKVGVGTQPLATNISPNKVVAGVFGNLLGAALSCAMFGLGLGLGWPTLAAIVVLCGMAAAYGDLAESMIKRAAGVKDSSSLIPYHGGMLDRIDSLLFVVPVIYVVLNVNLKLTVFG